MTSTNRTRRINLVPPIAVARNAEKGLALRERFGRGGTHVGVERARGLRAREPVSPHDIRRISSYFARHAVDKRSKSHVWGDEQNPSAGYIAWLLWGGDAGRRWADALKAKLNADKP
jgi:hypothetical protein